MDPSIADAIIKGLIIITVFLGVVVILLIALIMEMVEKHNSSKARHPADQTIRRQVADAEHRIERLMAEARAGMFEELK